MIERFEPSQILHEVVKHNGTLYLAGCVSEDLKLDMEGQARNVFAQIDQLLTRHGSDKHHVLSATIFVTDLNQKPAMNKAWRDWLPEKALPARATIGINDLGPGVLIEVVVTAAVR
ncbi:RidA family protein [Bradyrhizobium sp. NP1]|uniref:RidA family protein n=1 Tax=Bradyrhizobium sp. NP1 TaxID=3049772 RepID=UPI0025A50A42|nr:RidA family protein [Bradyrhizobium sp. NP1]WJR79457.1 RidA family protein [Bradyrhizobium sp. NP1]